VTASSEPADTIEDIEVSVLLHLVNAKLDWLHGALTTPPGSDYPPWPELPAAGWAWDHLHEMADFEATDEAQQG
jgi:hypothetical protein